MEKISLKNFENQNVLNEKISKCLLAAKKQTNVAFPF